MPIELPKPIAVTPVPNVRYREFTKCGQKPLSGGEIWTYEANSTTPKLTYQDPYGFSPNTNPIILDAAGEADIYLNGTYRFVVKDKHGVIQKDVAKIGSWFSGDLEDQFKSFNDALENSAEQLMQPLQDAIDTALAAGAGEAGWTDSLISTENGRTQRDKNKDYISVRDYIKTPIDGKTSNQQGIEDAFIDAFRYGFDLNFPAGTYISTKNIPHFNDVSIFGCGVIKRENDTFLVQPRGKSTNINRFYVSPNGSDLNDGLTSNFPLLTIQKGMDCISNFGSSLNGAWRIELAAGIYTKGGSMSDVRSNEYISIHCSESLPDNPKAIIDMKETASVVGIGFAQNMRVHCKGLLVKNINNGSKLESGFLIDAGTTGWFENCFTENCGQNGINANLRCRLLVSGGSYSGGRDCIRVYGTSSAYIGYGGSRVICKDSAVGVMVDGSSYSHTDYIDYINVTYGIVAESESHSTNYESTFENVSIGWESRSGSSINSVKYTFKTPPRLTKSRTFLGFGGVDDQNTPISKDTRNIVYFPALGKSGRWIFGYNEIVTPSCCYQFSANGGLSGVDMSLAGPVSLAIDASTTNYLGLYAPSSGFSGVAFGDELNANQAHIRHQKGSIYFNKNNVLTYRFTDTSFGPAIDNAIDIGSANFRTRTIYAATGAINTSDERMKQQFRNQSDREKSAALDIKKSICLFKFNDAVELKGDGARWHVGVKAQQVISILESHNLNPFEYAFICYDKWSAQDEICDAWDAEYDENGSIIRSAGSVITQPSLDAGDRYSIRYDELIMFIISAM